MPKEKYKHLIDSLENVLFPFQESEEEQESFTSDGRVRLNEWFEKFFIQLRKERIQNPSKFDNDSDNYFDTFIDGKGR